MGSLRTCNTCEKEFAESASMCPHCGESYENKKMRSCKTCEKEYAKSAGACPHCGATDGLPKVIVLVSICLIILMWGYIVSNGM